MRTYQVCPRGEKHRRFISAAVAAVGLACLASASLAVAAGGAQSSSTSFVLRQFTPTSYVDNPPKAGPNMNSSPGDILTASSTVYDATGTRRLGRTSELCIATVAKPMTLDCTIALIFRSRDELLVRGAINPTSTPWRAAIVGGYGRYAGARGSVRETSLSGTAERMTVTLTN